MMRAGQHNRYCTPVNMTKQRESRRVTAERRRRPRTTPTLELEGTASAGAGTARWEVENSHHR